MRRPNSFKNVGFRSASMHERCHSLAVGITPETLIGLVHGEADGLLPVFP